MPRPAGGTNTILPVSFPHDVHKKISEISEDTRLTKSTIVNLSIMAMLDRYEHEGSFVFVDLFDSKAETTGKFVNVSYSKETKEKLVRMSEDTGLSMKKLCVLATNSFIKRYEEKGIGVFASILKP